MAFESLDFRFYLKRELERRVLKNPHYTSRSFASDLGLTPQMLSQILQARNGISVSTASRIVDQLSLDESERVLFLNLVAAKHHRIHAIRKEAINKIQKLEIENELPVVKAISYRDFLDWYYNAIILLVEMPGVQQSAKGVSKKLGLPVQVAQTAIDKLFQAGLLIEDQQGRWRRGKINFAISSKEEMPELKKYYKQIIQKAEESIEEVPIYLRDISAALMNINRNDIDEVKEEIKKFRQALLKKMSLKTTLTDRTYGLAIQFFPITKDKK